MGGAILVKTLEDEGIGIERGIKKLSLKLFLIIWRQKKQK